MAFGGHKKQAGDELILLNVTAGAYTKGNMRIDNNAFLMIAAKDYDDIREPFDRTMAEIGVFFE